MANPFDTSYRPQLPQPPAQAAQQPPNWDGRERRNHCNDTDCPHLDDAVDKAVKRVFMILGVDVDKPESVSEFQEDLRFGKKLRKGADHGFLILIAVVVTAVMAAVWSGITTKINGASH